MVLPITVATVLVVVAVMLNVRGSYRVKVIVGMNNVVVKVEREADDETMTVLSVAVDVPVLR